ncbi:CACTA en-spm transposon protein [Cucumis melo var. makuwa]|uniref:CACTA en-spm transposon protein n=1 Tax=Cucumis melo var. makuwa TaxID=1194695 RepID=A0A5A7UH10_CUCMM|nr:CACTA en-spm transposon protein [Cucumis melo var. makuwa]
MGRSPMSIALGAKEANLAGFSNTISVLTRDTFPVYCIKWVDVRLEYIEVVKGGLQQWFMLDFTYQALNQFVEHQMLTTFKEYNDPKQAVSTHRTDL